MGAAGRADPVALVEGSRVVNSSQGGGSKDTWVLAPRASAAARELGAAQIVRSLPQPLCDPTVDASGYEPHDQQPQQQQQQQQQAFH